MEVVTTLDTTIPVWSILVAILIGVIHVVRMTIKIEQLSKEIKEIKEIIHQFLVPRK